MFVGNSSGIDRKKLGLTLVNGAICLWLWSLIWQRVPCCAALASQGCTRGHSALEPHPAARMPDFTQALGHISHFPAQGKRCSERSCSFAFKHYLKYFCYSRSQNFYYLKNRWRVGDRRFGCLGRFSFRNFFSICNLVVTLLVSSSFPSSGWPMFSSLLGGVLLLLTWE